MKKSFLSQLGHSKNVLPVLPIIHSCSAYSFRSILETKTLKPMPCDVFEGSEYLYSYYGIPSYRQVMSGSTGHPAYFPVCFIIDYEKVPPMDRMHPFDTGAFVKLDEMKAKYFHPNMELKHFELEPEITWAVRIVEKYFGSNINYVTKQNQLSTKDVESINFEEFSYVSLIEDETLGKLDSRVSTVELIHDSEIHLTKESLKHIILPSKFLDYPSIEKIIKEELGVENPGHYMTSKGNPNEFFGVILNEYVKYINSKGLS